MTIGDKSVPKLVTASVVRRGSTRLIAPKDARLILLGHSENDDARVLIGRIGPDVPEVHIERHEDTPFLSRDLLRRASSTPARPWLLAVEASYPASRNAAATSPGRFSSTLNASGRSGTTPRRVPVG